MFEQEGTSASSGILFWASMFAAVSALMLGWYAPTFELTHRLPVVDVEGTFDPKRTLQLIAAYGESGRHDYLVFLSIDCLFPVTASLFLISLYRPLLSGLAMSDKSRTLVLAVPALAAVCDLVENTFHALITMLYPRAAEPLAQLAWLATAAKFGALVATSVVLCVLVALWLRRRLSTPVSS